MRKGKKAKQGEEGAQDKTQPERKKNWKEYTATVEDIQNFIMDKVMPTTIFRLATLAATLLPK